MSAFSNAFNNAASGASEARLALDSWGITYQEQPGGTLFVPGDLDINGRDLTKLPDLSCVSVGGDFDCSGNQLTSLIGAPRTVGRGFFCHRNKLTSLQGAPASVPGNFNCSDNQLTSLKHAPAKVGEAFICDFNKLEYLEGAPMIFKDLVSDLGGYKSWDSVPVEKRASPEVRARQNEAIAIEATVVQTPILIKSALKFKGAAYAQQQ